MNKYEWFEVAESDLVTNDKPDLQTTLYVIRELLRRTSDSAEIKPTKTIEGAYKALRDYALKNQNTEHVFVCTASDDTAFKVFSEYLEIAIPDDNAVSNNGIVNLEDFF